MEIDLYKFYNCDFVNTIRDYTLDRQLDLLNEIDAQVTIFDLGGILKNEVKLGTNWDVFIVYDLKKSYELIVNTIIDCESIVILMFDEYLNNKCFNEDDELMCECVVCHSNEFALLVHYF